MPPQIHQSSAKSYHRKHPAGSSAGDYAKTHMLELSELTNLVGPLVQSAGHVTLTMENRDPVCLEKSFSYGSGPPATLLFTPKCLVTAG